MNRSTLSRSASSLSKSFSSTLTTLSSPISSLTSSRISGSLKSPSSSIFFRSFSPLKTSSTPHSFRNSQFASINIRNMTSDSTSKVHFSSFDVTSQVFFFNSSKSMAGIVNLKPIVPCHVLLIPTKSYKSFSELSSQEVAELFQSVQHVSNVLKKELNADALTISIQDGEAAGQSVPHLHVHVLPRKKGDFEPNDKIYPLLEKFGHSLSSLQSQRERGSVAPDDEERKPRSEKEMIEEANWLRGLM